VATVGTRLETETSSSSSSSSSVDAKQVLGFKTCKISTLSTDTRGTPRVTIEVGGKKENEKRKHFPAYYISWIEEYGRPPDGAFLPDQTKRLQYAHRCHNHKCVEPTHGIWLNDSDNKAQNSCQTSSHVIIEGLVYVTCRHSPICCIAPVIVDDSVLSMTVEDYKETLAKIYQSTKDPPPPPDIRLDAVPSDSKNEKSPVDEDEDKRPAKKPKKQTDIASFFIPSKNKWPVHDHFFLFFSFLLIIINCTKGLNVF